MDTMQINYKMVMGLLLITSFVLMSGIANAWFYSDATNRNNLTLTNTSATVFNFPFAIKQNFTGFASSCIDYSIVNVSDNERLQYYTENNTCSIGADAVIWANAYNVTTYNQSVGWIYHNFITPFDNSTQYGVFDPAVYRYVFHMDQLTASQKNYIASGLNATRLINGNSTANGAFGNGITLFGNSTDVGGGGLEITNGWVNFNTQNITIEIWFNSSTQSGGRPLLGFNGGGCEVGINPGQAGAGGVRWFAINPQNVVFDNLASGVAHTANASEYWVFSYDGFRAFVHKNGLLLQQYSSSGNKSLCTGNFSFYIGSGSSGGLPHFMGIVDEVRISPFNLSNEYITSVWENRNGAILGANETFAFTISVLDPSNITYATPTRYLNVTSGQLINKWWYILNGGANVTFTPNTTFTGTSGLNTLKVFANISTGTMATQEINFTVTDPTPIISIISPGNTTYVVTNTTLTTIFIDNDPSSFWYILNAGTNVTFNQNTTFIGILGSNVLNVYMNDTLGQMANASVSFSINTTVPTPPTPGATPTDPNVLLFIVVLAIVMIGLFWLIR